MPRYNLSHTTSATLFKLTTNDNRTVWQIRTHLQRDCSDAMKADLLRQSSRWAAKENADLQRVIVIGGRLAS